MSRGIAIWIGALVFVWYSCEKAIRPLESSAYVWQRNWDGAVSQAVVNQTNSVAEWRVLACEANGRGQMVEVSIDRDALRKSGKKVVAVVRVDGSANLAPAGDRALALAQNWQKDGLPVSGIEIDYDCGVGHLAAYRDYLKSLRRSGLKLSITALPSWIESGDLPGLLAVVDEAVLQVHSVMKAKRGLFDKITAETWVRKWAERSRTPFWVAVPTYWSRVTWDDAGKVTAIESEAQRYGSDGTSEELFVDPREVSSFVRDLRNQTPPHFAGFAWFRLPTEKDRRAWSAETWRAVMSGRPLAPGSASLRVRENSGGARDLFLASEGTIDGPLPRLVTVAAKGCEFADSFPPYEAERRTDGVTFHLKGSDILRARQERQIGWIRCEDKEMNWHVAF